MVVRTNESAGNPVALDQGAGDEVAFGVVAERPDQKRFEAQTLRATLAAPPSIAFSD